MAGAAAVIPPVVISGAPRRAARLPGVAMGGSCRHAEVMVLSAVEPILIASADPVGLHVMALEFSRGSV